MSANRIFEMINELRHDKLVSKHLYKYTWLSGCSTEVYPIMVHDESEIVLQWDSDKNIFDKFIKRYIKKYNDVISDGWFCKSDGSCPSSIKFIIKRNKG